MSSRASILKRLKQAARPYETLVRPDEVRAVAPAPDSDPATLQEHFVEQARALSCGVYLCPDEATALRHLLTIIGDDRTILSWNRPYIPLGGVDEALAAAGIQVAATDDPAVRVGLTGADAALAATGSLVLVSGEGRSRLVSLLPPVHITVLRSDQIVPNLEAWIARQREAGLPAFALSSNTVIISGPSRTADIAMTLVLGAHGPAEEHILIVAS